jgi:hypothetical protein
VIKRIKADKSLSGMVLLLNELVVKKLDALGPMA